MFTVPKIKNNKKIVCYLPNINSQLIKIHQHDHSTGKRYFKNNIERNEYPKFKRLHRSRIVAAGEGRCKGIDTLF